MNSAFALACASVIALVACAPTHATSADVRSGAAPATVASAAPASSASSAPASTAPGTAVAAAAPVAAGGVPPRPLASASASAVMGPAPSPAPSASPSADPSAAVATAPPQAASAQKTAEPAQASGGVPFVAPDAPPQILSFAISATVVHPGDVLSGSVTASSNVASVEVRVAGYSYNMVKTAPGEFALAVTVPSVPRIFRRTYPLVAIARNTRGDATQRTTQITIR